MKAGTTLYGTTLWGGWNDVGTIFSIEEDGTAFRLLHYFTGGAGDGSYPAFLTISGSTLYGMATHGGDNNPGVIYALDIPQ